MIYRYETITTIGDARYCIRLVGMMGIAITYWFVDSVIVTNRIAINSACGENQFINSAFHQPQVPFICSTLRLSPS
ncbi:hypothetical protein [Pseudoalteromonas sp. MMG005]|uniref:hypothetical protein n=1 Tax=Pseudoalteromonas sp. MMG005 TaxID=2822682 RepID=UPI001B3A13DC|nr:hypothetical protein [Pseudoalteromonas sp. MMG005]MBQ4847837.1 hypothetical protein [Pseudoalteromonas sp. MMG005]